MLDEKPAQLVAHLAHPNGWWRDTAQKLLILAQDQSVVPALTEMARSHPETLARLHALWTLEGLGALTPALVREKLADASPQLRAAAIRVSESLIQKGDTSLQPAILAMAKDKDADVVIQSFLTAKLLNFPENKALITSLIATSPHAGVKEFGGQIVAPVALGIPMKSLSGPERQLYKAGGEIFSTLCAACHGADAKGLPMVGAAPGVMLAPSLVGSKTITGPREASIRVLLHGLTGDIDGKKYEGQMISMATNDDKWIASVLSYVRNSFGNRAGFTAPPEVARERAAGKDRTQPWTIAELRTAIPQPLDRKSWKLTASHSPETLAAAIDGKPDTRYSTKSPQVPGMWIQLELPAVTDLARIIMDATGSARDYPRGYKVELSTDGATWSKPVATGTGSDPVTDIVFAPAKAKFIRITQTGSVNRLSWSIHELNLFAPTTPVVAGR
ncbi:MAG: discoidin domain-containing protein [Chthoniobacterales bacterium]